MVTKWEHIIINLPLDLVDSECKLNEQVNDGWELIAIIQYPNPKSFYPGAKSDLFAFFKKQV